MYPDPIVFTKAPSGTGPLLIRWVLATPADGVLLYRSPRPVAPSETELFYAQTLDLDIRCAHLPAAQTSAIDPDSSPAFYCGLARRESGLFALELRFERLIRARPLPDDVAILRASRECANPLNTSPSELVFAKNDSKALFAIESLASGLANRFTPDGATDSTEAPNE
ncbi:MAG: hypothetical protein VX223_00725 [Myxococcota bacterium]|nr:hypothetical protein [Myxococcota bacterium]